MYVIHLINIIDVVAPILVLKQLGGLGECLHKCFHSLSRDDDERHCAPPTACQSLLPPERQAHILLRGCVTEKKSSAFVRTRRNHTTSKKFASEEILRGCVTKKQNVPLSSIQIGEMTQTQQK